ncbi:MULTISPECIES: hypothetical protein [unclassified Curtobacterium]|uniref:hypothetical protein n=1 Tax=unclassified Curtobacterium TaxID=257496 RepID=UPI00381C9969
MTTTSVPDFLSDEDYESPATAAADPSPVALEQPVAQQQPQASTTIGAVRKAEEVDEPAEINPVLNGDDEEFDGESTASAYDQTPANGQPMTGREWKERVAAGEVNGWEHPNRGKDRNSPTKKKGSTYRRKRLTEKDFLVLGFLQLFEFITTKQVGVLRNLSEPSARRLMLGLQEFGVIGQEKIEFGPQLWYLTGKGHSYLRTAMEVPVTAQPLHRSGQFDLSKIRPNLLASQVAAQLMAGTDTIRKHVSVPLSAGLDLLPFLIPERYMRASFNSALQPQGTRSKFSDGRERGKAIQSLWQDIERNRPEGQSVDALLLQHPELWMIVGKLIYTGPSEAKYQHPADLALNLTPIGLPSIAVEIELSMKTPDEMRRIVATYFRRESPTPIGMVIYLTNQKAIAKRVMETAQEYYDEMEQQTGKPEKDRKQQPLFRTALLTDAEGKLFSGNVWDL